MKNKPVLYIIIPCYNEEKVLPITAPLFKQEIMKLINRNIISVKSKIMFVNDGNLTVPSVPPAASVPIGASQRPGS